jgi:arsenate reductase (glutaredoxin)
MNTKKTKIKLYYNPDCSKSRAALTLLTDLEYDVIIYDYINEGISIDEIILLSSLLDASMETLVRVDDNKFREIENSENFSSFSIAEKQKFIFNNPLILQRPIVIKEDIGIIARPPEKILEIF